MDVSTLLSFGPEGWGDDIAAGLLVTLSLSLATLPIGLLIGFFVAVAKTVRRSRHSGWPATSTPPSSAACPSF